MSFYFVLELRIFVMIENTNDVSYFVLKLFVIMGSINDVWFLCLTFFTLLYFTIR